MGIKLVALDMDGTTLQSDITLARETIVTIEKAVSQGIIVVPTTGRVFGELPEEITDIDGVSYAITSNGAQVTDLNRKMTLYENSLTKQDLDTVLKVLRQYDLMIEAYVGGRTVVIEDCMKDLSRFHVPEAYWDFFRETRHTIADPEDYFNFLYSHSVEKFNIFFSHMENRSELKTVLENTTDLTITSAVENNLEINNPTANKWDGLKHLCRHLNIQSTEVMAMGDSNNDYEMLKHAGLAVAMENGIDRVKEISDFITKTNDEHGVAYALEKFILNPKADKRQELAS